MDDLSELRRRADFLVARRDVLRQSVAKNRDRLEDLSRQEQDHVDAIPIVLKIGQVHRQLSLEKIEALVTSALKVVFEHPYTFKLKQEEKRGQIELVPVVIDGDLELEPASSMGGGIVDILSIALRIILWSMMADRSDPVLVMDEPARHVNSERSVRNLASLFEQVSKSMGIQFVIVTNRPALSHKADAVFSIHKSAGESRVEVRG